MALTVVVLALPTGVIAPGVAAAGPGQDDDTTSSSSSSTTTTTSSTTTTTTTTTTTSTTTTTTQPSTTTTSSTTTTTAPTTSTTTDDDDDDGVKTALLWGALGLLALAIVGVLAWLIGTLVRRRSSSQQWERRRDAVLDQARHAHDDAVDLLARWTSLRPDQLSPRWSSQMSSLDRLRTRLSELMASAPDGVAVSPMQRVAGAVDDLRLALGNAGVGADPVAAPVDGPSAAAALDQAIENAQHPPKRHH